MTWLAVGLVAAASAGACAVAGILLARALGVFEHGLSPDRIDEIRGRR